MTSNFNRTVACLKCHHTDHAISEELHTFRLFYGQVRRSAFYCTHCDCTRPLPLPAWLMMKWRGHSLSITGESCVSAECERARRHPGLGGVLSGKWRPLPRHVTRRATSEGALRSVDMSSIKEAYTVMPQPRRPLTAAKSPRKFVLLAIGSAVTCFIAFILMQLAFGAAGSAGLLAFEILGFVLFVLFLASAATTLVGIIGMLLRLAGRERAPRDSNL